MVKGTDKSNIVQEKHGEGQDSEFLFFGALGKIRDSEKDYFRKLRLIYV